MFGQVARKLQHEARFTVLPPSLTPLQLSAFGIVERPEGPVLMRIEEGVDALVYTGPNESTGFLEFVRDNNVALVTELARNNFRAMGKMGRPLELGPFDLVVGSDLLYSPESFGDLVDTLEGVCEVGRTEVWLAYPERYTEGIFFGMVEGVLDEVDRVEIEPAVFWSKLLPRG